MVSLVFGDVKFVMVWPPFSCPFAPNSDACALVVSRTVARPGDAVDGCNAMLEGSNALVCMRDAESRIWHQVFRCVDHVKV